MKNIFSPKLYVQGLRKVRTVGIAMAIIIIVLNALIPVISMIESQMFRFPGQLPPAVENVEISLFAPFGISVLLFAPLMVYVMFSYLNERKSSDFYHAIPQKRICVYFSFIAAILTWLVSVLLATTIVNSIFWAVAKYYTVTIDAVVLTTVAYVVLAVMMVGFAVLAMMLTGTTVSNCLVFALVFLFVRTLGLMFLYSLEEAAPMFNETNSWLQMFSLEFFLPLHLFVDIFDQEGVVFYNAGMMFYWFIVGLALIGFSAWLYHKRKSESATKSAPSPILQHIYRIAVTLPFMLLTVVMIVLDQGLESYHFIFVVIAALVYVIYELLTTKKIKNVIRSLPLFLVPVMLSAAFAGGVYMTKGIMYATTPDADEIKSVTLIDNTYGSYEDICIYNIPVSDEEIIELTAKAIEATKRYEKDGPLTVMSDDGYYTNVRTYRYSVCIEKSSGFKVSYDLRCEIDLESAFEETEACLKKFIELPPREELYNKSFAGYYNMSFNEQMIIGDIVDSFYAEWNMLTSEQKLAYKQKLTNKYDSSSYCDALRLYGKRGGNISYSSEYPLSEEYFPQTTQLYLELCEKYAAPLKMLREMQKKMNGLESEDMEEWYVKMMIESVGAEGAIQYYQLDTPEVLRDFLSAITIDEHLIDYENGALYRCDYVFETKNSYSMIVDLKDVAEKEIDSENGLAATTQTQYVDDKMVYYYGESGVWYLTFSKEDLQSLSEILESYYGK